MAKDAKGIEIKVGDYVVFNKGKQTGLKFGYVQELHGMKVTINSSKIPISDDFFPISNDIKNDKSTLIINEKAPNDNS